MACKAVQWQSLGCLAAATVYPDFLMLRITEIKLPLDHAPEALQAALLKKLDITANDLVGFTIYRRGFDARKKSDIQLVYTLDAEVKNEASLIQMIGRVGRNIEMPTGKGLFLCTRKTRDIERCIQALQRMNRGDSK